MASTLFLLAGLLQWPCIALEGLPGFSWLVRHLVRAVQGTESLAWRRYWAMPTL